MLRFTNIIQLLGGTSIIFLMFLSGCGSQEDTPSFNFIRTELVLEMFRALEEGNSKVVLNTAERLEHSSQKKEALGFIIADARNRLFLNRLNELIRNGRVEKAKSLLSQRNIRYTEREKFESFENVLHALNVIGEYFKGRPYESGYKAYLAFNQTRERARILTASECFTTWHKKEKERLLERRKQECISGLWRIIRRTGSPEADAIIRLDNERLLDRLCSDLGETVFVKWRRGLKGNALREIVSLLESNNIERQLTKNVEILASWYWPTLSRNVKKRLWTFMREKEPASAAGNRLRCLLAVEQEAVVQGIHFLRNYSDDRPDVDEKLLEQTIPVLVIPWQQLKAAPWLQPFPRFSDALAQAIQIHLQKLRRNKN